MTDLVILATGGTGGHIIPAIALAEEMQRTGVTCEIVGDEKLSGFVRSGMRWRQVADHAAYKQSSAVFTALRVCKDVFTACVMMVKQRPSLVVGFGGYSSFATLVAAKLLRIKTIAYEPNMVMGKANRCLARFVTQIAIASPHTIYASRWKSKSVVVERVVRQGFSPAPILSTNCMTILVIGGSQGAAYFARAIPPILAALHERKRIRVMHQCRVQDEQMLRSFYSKLDALVAPFFDPVEQYFAQADLIIARAGASTLAEIEAMQRPAILIPLPNSADDHQYWNALEMMKSGLACVVEEGDGFEDRLLLALENSPHLCDVQPPKRTKAKKFSEVVENLIRPNL